MTGAPRSRLLSTPLVLLVCTGSFTSTVRWLEMLAVGVFVFDRTGSPFMVALMTVLRMLPMALFGIFVGALTERLHRLPILIGGLALMGFQSIVIGYVAEAGRLEIWHLGLAGFLSGVFWSTDFSVRRTLIGDVVPAGRLANAMSLDVMSNNGSRMLGPALGGVLLQAVGLAGAYYLSALAYFLGLAAVLLMRHRETPPTGHGSVIVGVIEGLRYLRGERALAAVLMVTIIFNVFGWPYLSMVPVIGRDALALSASEIGLLASLEGAGVLVVASWLVLFAPPLHFRRIYFFGVAGFIGSALVFAASSLVPVSALAMLAAGFGSACFATMQSTLVMLLAEPRARNRMMGVLALCIGTAPIGLLHLGWLADTLGAQPAVAITAIEGMLALLAVRRAWPEILAPQALPGSEPGHDR